MTVFRSHTYPSRTCSPAVTQDCIWRHCRINWPTEAPILENILNRDVLCKSVLCPCTMICSAACRHILVRTWNWELEFTSRSWGSTGCNQIPSVVDRSRRTSGSLSKMMMMRGWSSTGIAHGSEGESLLLHAVSRRLRKERKRWQAARWPLNAGGMLAEMPLMQPANVCVHYLSLPLQNTPQSMRYRQQVAFRSPWLRTRGSKDHQNLTLHPDRAKPVLNSLPSRVYD